MQSCCTAALGTWRQSAGARMREAQKQLPPIGKDAGHEFCVRGVICIYTCRGIYIGFDQEGGAIQQGIIGTRVCHDDLRPCTSIANKNQQGALLVVSLCALVPSPAVSTMCVGGWVCVCVCVCVVNAKTDCLVFTWHASQVSEMAFGVSPSVSGT